MLQSIVSHVVSKVGVKGFREMNYENATCIIIMHRCILYACTAFLAYPASRHPSIQYYNKGIQKGGQAAKRHTPPLSSRPNAVYLMDGCLEGGQARNAANESNMYGAL